MATKITAYQSKDGVVFMSEVAAVEHDTRIALQNLLADVLSEMDNDFDSIIDALMLNATAISDTLHPLDHAKHVNGIARAEPAPAEAVPYAFPEFESFDKLAADACAHVIKARSVRGI